MKILRCELCGGNELLKQNGVYVCQYCGAKYAPDEARKLLVEGNIDISGSTIKIDETNAEELGAKLEYGRMKA